VGHHIRCLRALCPPRPARVLPVARMQPECGCNRPTWGTPPLPRGPETSRAMLGPDAHTCGGHSGRFRLDARARAFYHTPGALGSFAVVSGSSTQQVARSARASCVALRPPPEPSRRQAGAGTGCTGWRHRRCHRRLQQHAPKQHRPPGRALHCRRGSPGHASSRVPECVGSAAVDYSFTDGIHPKSVVPFTTGCSELSGGGVETLRRPCASEPVTVVPASISSKWQGAWWGTTVSRSGLRQLERH